MIMISMELSFAVFYKPTATKIQAYSKECHAPYINAHALK